mmetsp:Transcript_114917/g.263878  ORF Transcript_114917/g.263878 Transcript_114917/m.263878 type:complete len:91 (-) Transcript_114917:298-570(-)
MPSSLNDFLFASVFASPLACRWGLDDLWLDDLSLLQLAGWPLLCGSWLDEFCVADRGWTTSALAFVAGRLVGCYWRLDGRWFAVCGWIIV